MISAKCSEINSCMSFFYLIIVLTIAVITTTIVVFSMYILI